MEDVLFTVKETAKLFKCNGTFIYSLIKSGHLKALKLGQYKIPKFEIDDFLKRYIGKDFSDLSNVKDLDLNKIGREKEAS
ncbi:helix-turn-helix domain-containing protein [Heyndrickxia oleronia]|uniref:helix-turn-helix domain-containing protein n=1 Tax=Heyndrickxia oleronia TaxID=38875 RepID=UPI00333C94C3